jgi:hypothetical protein
MSFTGDLEHLPIVDIVQLLHAARKSGTLLVRGKTESQLVFQEGRVVSAIHRGTGARLGRILLESKLLSSDTLAQVQAGADQGKGLVAALLQQGLLNQEQALTVLEKLLQMNLVEMLTWAQGTFSLEVDAVPIADEFRLLAEATGQPVRFDTQGLLMDALRIFDEKTRDGEFDDEFFSEEEPELAAGSTMDGDMAALSLEDLGLDGLDQLERKIPDVFTSLHDPHPIDPQQLHLQRLAAELSPEQSAELWKALKSFAEPGGVSAAASGRTLLFYSADALVSYCLTVVCKGSGIPLFTTTDVADIEPFLAQFLGKGMLPLLIIDGADVGQGEFSGPRLAELRRQLLRAYPQLPVVEWQSSVEPASFLHSYRDGVRGVFPRPSRSDASFVSQLLLLLESFLVFAQVGFGPATAGHLPLLQSSVRELPHLKEIPEIADLLLRFVAALCPRALILVAAPPGLVAGRSLGIATETGEAPPLRLQIPLDETSSLRQVLEEGSVVLASHGDGVLRRHLYPLIGAPAAPAVLLLPLLCRGKKIALIYGDFGQQPLAPLPLELLEVLASQAALQIEVALYRKKLEK